MQQSSRPFQTRLIHMDYCLLVLFTWLIRFIVFIHEAKQTTAVTTYPIEFSIKNICLDGYQLKDPNGKTALKFRKLGNNIYERNLSLSGDCHSNGGQGICVVSGHVLNKGTFRLEPLNGTVGREECNLTSVVNEATTLPETTTTMPITTTTISTPTTSMPITTTTMPITISTMSTTTTSMPITTTTMSSPTTTMSTPTATSKTTTSTELPTTVSTATAATTTSKTNISADFITIRPLRLKGKLSGELNNVSFDEVGIEFVINAVKGRSIISFNSVSQSLMTSLPAVINEICSLIGWMFAIPEEDNGNTYTDGRCTRKAIIKYDTGETVIITQRFDKIHQLKVDTRVEGTVPRTESNISVDIEEYYDLYHQVHPGRIRSDSRRSYMIGNTSMDYNISQTVTYDTQSAGNADGPSNTTNVTVSKISTSFGPGSVRFRMTSRVFTVTDNNASIRITTSPAAPRERDTFTKYMLYIIPGAVVLIIIVGALLIVICVKARRTHKLNAGIAVNDVAHPAENAEYMEIAEVSIYEEIEPVENTVYYSEGRVDIQSNNPVFVPTPSTSADYLTPISENRENETLKQQDYESLLVSRSFDEYSSFKPQEEIETVNSIYDCEEGVDFKANNTADCPTATTSADYLTPLSKTCKKDTLKQQNNKTLRVSKPENTIYDCGVGVDFKANNTADCPTATTSADYLTPLSKTCKNDTRKQQNNKTLRVSKPENTIYDCGEGVDFRANNTADCPTATTSADYLTPLSKTYKNDTRKQQNNKTLPVSKYSEEYPDSFKSDLNGIQNIIAGSGNSDNDSDDGYEKATNRKVYKKF